MFINDIFKKYLADFKKLEEYGFKKQGKDFVIEKFFKDNLFKALITVDFEGKISGTVFEIENDEEFLPLRAEISQGAFVGEIRALFEGILLDIREKCFMRQYFIYPQSNRITRAVIEKYGSEPEFLWEKFDGSGVFRNNDTKKWFLAILDVDRSKIRDGKGLIEVADIKLSAENVEKLTKLENFYPGYHMNKKYWLTVILDDSLPDEKIMELIEESYSFSVKK